MRPYSIQVLIKRTVRYELNFVSDYLCTGGEARTPDTRFWRPVLYQLSYSRICGCKGNAKFSICKDSTTFFAEKKCFKDS